MQKTATDNQLALSFNHTDNSLKQYLEECLNRPVSVVLTGNSTTMLSARIHDNVLRVRLHRMFLTADGRVVNEIVSYLKTRRGAMPHFRGFIRDNKVQLRLKPPRKIPVRIAGKFHDLRGLYDEINTEYFGGAINAVITWGSRSPRYAVRKRTVGSYSERSNMIRINPVLDRKTVPRYYVAFIIYHEMLHAVMGTAIQGKRRSVHSRDFRKREKLFKDYEKVQAWENGKT
jgi:predicted SprT family Zn-dependent metalloprotease